MRRIICSVFLVVITTSLFGQLNCFEKRRLGQFNPYISLLSPFTIYQPNYSIQKGEFDLRDRLINWGIGFGNTFQFRNNYFLRLGFNYINQQHSILAKNRIDYWQYTEYPIIWERNTDAMTIPIVIGKKWLLNGSRIVDGYFGGSFGIMQLGQHAFELHTEQFNGFNPFDGSIVGEIEVEKKMFPIYYLMTMDFGVNIQPFKRYPKFTMGMFSCIQLNNIKQSYRYVGYQNDVLRNVKHDFDITYQVGRNYSLGFKLSYNF